MTIWCDNCSGQNKNWTLFSSIVHLLANGESDCMLNTVTLKFFEKEHTFMSADSFHHAVENEIRVKKRMYDFDDFVKCVENCGVAVLMKPNDFFDYMNEKGSGKNINCPLLRKLSVIQFRKYSSKIFWKNNFSEDEYQESEFLKKKTQRAFLNWKPYPSKGQARGITHSKKVEIVNKLSRFMKPCHLRFWEDLATSVESEDLTINIEHLPKEKN